MMLVHFEGAVLAEGGLPLPDGARFDSPEQRLRDKIL
jgi:hypothetical protein